MVALGATPAVADKLMATAFGALVVWDGRTLHACWQLDGAAVSLVDEEGDTGAIPMEAFRAKVI